MSLNRCLAPAALVLALASGAQAVVPRPLASLSHGSLRPTRLRCEYASAPLGIDAPRPRLSWELTETAPGMRNLRQTAYRVLAASDPARLQPGRADRWDSGRVVSSLSACIEYAGRPLRSGERVWWTVLTWDERGRISSPAAPASWEMGLLGEPSWRARWVRESPDERRNVDPYANRPAPLLRREFVVAKPVARARAYVSGLGYYELRLNGRKVGDHILDPGWTSYARRVPYSTFDVTPLLEQGHNAAGVMLGRGWYDPLPLPMWGHINLREHLTIGSPRAIVQIEIRYRDGSRQTVVTDETWRTHSGPIVRDSVYLGERYDARAELAGWDRAGFRAEGWAPAEISPEPVGSLTAQVAPPVRATRLFPARAVSSPQPGVFIFDLGQNFAGWARLRVAGAEPGRRIVLRYGEILYRDGRLNPMTSVAGQIKGMRVPPGSEAPSVAWQEDSYTCRGAQTETYTPRFTFHGFRYVEVTGYPGTPPPGAIEGIGLSSDVETAGTFTCSSPLLNRIQGAFRETLLSNLFSVQSDCPHREKFGYGGDIVATSDTAMYNFDMARFYEKSIIDLADAVRPNGGFTETAPYVGISDAGLGGGAGPVEWGTAHPHLLWQRYMLYGDIKTLREQEPAAARWQALLRASSVGYILDNGLSDHESLAPKPTALTGTAFYYYNTSLMARIERALGRPRQAREYEAESAAISAAFNRRFLAKGEGRYGEATQASQAIPLTFGLVPQSEADAAVEVLARDVDAHGGHLTTGIFGTPALLRALSDGGRAETAFTIASQTTYPGWGWMLENGATTLWEHWEGSDNTFSHNHPMFGSVSGWFFRSLAGIDADSRAVGFSRAIIRPHFVRGLAWARADYRSMRGPVRSEWARRGPFVDLHVAVPPNVTANVVLDAARPGDVREISVPAGAAPSTFKAAGPGTAACRIGSGDYRFRIWEGKQGGR